MGVPKMSIGQRDSEISKYHKFMVNFIQAAERSYSPEQSAIYTRYAKKFARHIADLKKGA